MFSLDAYWTLRNAAAIVRRSDRAVLVVTGRDRATWLQGLLTNDVLVLQEGQSCYAAYLTPQGRMITDMQVIALADRVWLDVPAPLAASLRDRLDGLIFAEEAQVSDASGAIAVWGLYGQKLPRLPSTRPPGFEDSSHGVPGFTLYLEHNGPLPPALADLPEAGLETLDVLRIEAGTPKFLQDMTEDTIPLEAGIEDRAISFTKGCYVGQEVIVRVTHRGGGRVAKRLVRWSVAGPASTSQPAFARSNAGELRRGLAEAASGRGGGHLPALAVLPGSRILCGDRDIGRVTSAAFSPAQNALIGLGYVHRDFTAPGTTIAVHAGEGRIDAVVI